MKSTGAPQLTSRTKSLLCISLIAAAAFYGAPVTATVITDATQYQGLFPGLTTIDFEGLIAPGGIGGIALSISPLGATGPTISSPAGVVAVDSGFSNLTIPSAPSDYIHSSFSASLSSFVISLPANTLVAGFNFGELLRGGGSGNLPGTIEVDVFSGAKSIFSDVFTTSNTSVFDSFFGIYNVGPVSEIRLRVLTSLSAVALDNLSYGSASISVSEPNSWLLFSACFAGIILIQVSRRQGVTVRNL